MKKIPQCIVYFFEDQYNYMGCLTGVKIFCEKDKREEIAQSFRCSFKEFIKQEIRALLDDDPWHLDEEEKRDYMEDYCYITKGLSH